MTSRDVQLATERRMGVRQQQLIEELRAENKRLREHVEILTEEGHAALVRLQDDIKTWGRIWNDVEMLAARVEALRDGTAQT